MKNALEVIPRQRNKALDRIRVIATAAVVMIHVSSGFVSGYAPGSLGFLWGNIFDSLSQVAVPLFIMLSGALLLDEEKEISVRQLLGKRLPQIVLLLIVWSAIYAVRYEVIAPLLSGNRISIRSFVDELVTGHYHLWYLYLQIGLYLSVPFLRKIVCRKNEKLVLLFLAVSLSMQFALPIMRSVFTHWGIDLDAINSLQEFVLGFFNVQFTYFLAGWYLVHVGIPQKKHRLLFYGAAPVCALIVIVYVHITGNYINGYSIDSIPVYIYAAGVFLWLYYGGKDQCSGKFLSLLSKSTFGIYIVHIFVMNALHLLLPSTWAAPLYMLVCWCLTFAAAFLVTYGLSRIPYCRKLIRM